MSKFNSELLAKRVREKRGKRGLREIADEMQIGASTLSRVERGMLPALTIFPIICKWLGDNPAMYFSIDEDADDPIVGQLRAAKNMSAETASAFMEIIRAAYEQILEAADDEDKA